MEIPKEFFTPETFFTLSGCSTAVWLTTGAIGYLFEYKISLMIKKWIAFGLSMLFAMLMASILPDKTIVSWVIAGVNGILIFVTSVGVNTIVSQTPLSINESPIKKTSAGKNRLVNHLKAPWF